MTSEDWKSLLPAISKNIIERVIRPHREEIVRELVIRKNILARLPLEDRVHRNMIRRYIANKELPSFPSTFGGFHKQFLISSFSYSVLRKSLTAINLGQTPSTEDIPSLLNRIFANYDAFDYSGAILDNASLSERKALEVAERKWGTDTYDCAIRYYHSLEPALKLEPENRILAILLTAPNVLRERIARDVNGFEREVDAVCRNRFEMWEFAKDFSISIPNVGVNLTCDFLKEIGFKRYVKIDVHMIEEIPNLANTQRTLFHTVLAEYPFSIKEGKVAPQNPYNILLFILSSEIADELNMDPFHLDKLLYVWGWAKNKGFC